MLPQNVQFKLCKENICVNFCWVIVGRWTLKPRLFLMVKLSWLAALPDVWLHVTERKMIKCFGWKYDLNAAIYCLASVSAESWQAGQWLADSWSHQHFSCNMDTNLTKHLFVPHKISTDQSICWYYLLQINQLQLISDHISLSRPLCFLLLWPGGDQGVRGSSASCCN